MRSASASAVTASILLACFSLVAFVSWTSASNLPEPSSRREEFKRVAERVAYLVYHDRPGILALMREALPRYMDNPESCRIELEYGTPLELLGGKFKEIRITLEGSMVKGLRIEKAFFLLRNPVIDWVPLIEKHKFKVIDEGQVDLFLKVSEKDVNEMFRRKRKKLKVRSPVFDFRFGHIRFSGGLRVLFFKNRVKLAGRLSIRNGEDLYFHPRWMNIGFMPVPGFVVRSMMRRINPIASFRKFKFKIRLSVIEITDDYLYVATKGFEHLVREAVKEEAEHKLKMKRGSLPDGGKRRLDSAELAYLRRYLGMAAI